MALNGGSFIGVPFGRVQTDGPAVSIILGREYNYSATDIAGGDATIVQIGGIKGQTVSENIAVDEASLTAFLGKLGQTGTLVLHGTTYRATLVAYGRIARRPISVSLFSATWVVA